MSFLPDSISFADTLWEWMKESLRNCWIVWRRTCMNEYTWLCVCTYMYAWNRFIKEGFLPYINFFGAFLLIGKGIYLSIPSLLWFFKDHLWYYCHSTPHTTKKYCNPENTSIFNFSGSVQTMLSVTIKYLGVSLAEPEKQTFDSELEFASML